MKNKILLAAINALFLFGVVFAGLKILDFSAGVEFSIELSKIKICIIVALSCSLLLLSSLSWLILIQRVPGSRVSYSDAIEQTALMLVSKYVPGKVWGVVARAAALGRYVGMGNVVVLSVIEQLVALYVAISLGSILIISYHSVLWALCLFTSFIFFGYYPFLYLCRLVIVIEQRLNRKKWFQGAELDISKLNYSFYMKIFALYIVLWTNIAAILWVLLQSLSLELSVSQYLLLTGSYMLAVATGFLALFAPGGIGVREGVMVLVSSSILPPPIVLKISLTLRLWNTMYDLIFGCLGYLMHVYKSRKRVGGNV